MGQNPDTQTLRGCKHAVSQIPRLVTMHLSAVLKFRFRPSLTRGRRGRRCSTRGGQPARAPSNAEILIVAKLEKVSEIAYGRTMRSPWRMAPHVYTTFGT